jgi:hypothetical protein
MASRPDKTTPTRRTLTELSARAVPSSSVYGSEVDETRPVSFIVKCHCSKIGISSRPDLPPRTMAERCARHKHCAYRDDDPDRYPLCHASDAKCSGSHGKPPIDSKSGKQAAATHPSLKAGQYLDPREASNRRMQGSQPSGDTSTAVAVAS